MTDLDVLRIRIDDAIGSRMPDHVERLGWDADRLAEYQRLRLRRLLTHAVRNSPFHARRLAGIDPDRFELADLEGVAVMTKTQMMDAFDDVVTDRRLSRALVDEHLATSAGEPRLLLGEYVCLASGGSSGLRGVFVQTIGEFVEFSASILRRRIRSAAAASGPPGQSVVVAMVTASSPVHASGFAAATSGAGPVQVVSIAATLPTAEIVERLNALQAPVLIGYPSKLTELAAEQRAGRLRIAPEAVTATSEMFAPRDRASVESAFGVPVIDQFASTEGLVGHSEPGDPVLIFASDTCIVELVNADNRPIADGVASAKVLLTNLDNLTQPLIRYELTDRFVRQPSATGDGHLRAAVEGRADDVFHYGPTDIHPLVIRTVMVATPAIREYQVRQTAAGVEAAVVTDGELDEAALAAALTASLRRAGLPDPSVVVRTIDAVDRHPETGKTLRFIAL